VLDSKREATRRVTDEAPRIVDEISSESRERFERVLEGLDALGITYRIEPRLVRGLDYYTHTTFEFQASALESAQNGIGGGGRYDGLAAALGGPPTAGVGFGSGIERILLACDAEGVFGDAETAPSVFVIDVVDGRDARDIVADARRAGLRADRAYGGRSMKAQMKAADRSGATLAVIIGQDEQSAGEVTLRDLRGDTDQERVPRDAIIDHLRKRL
jgi:histidyl-tRNA synthetase